MGGGGCAGKIYIHVDSERYMYMIYKYTHTQNAQTPFNISLYLYYTYINISDLKETFTLPLNVNCILLVKNKCHKDEDCTCVEYESCKKSSSCGSKMCCFNGNHCSSKCKKKT